MPSMRSYGAKMRPSISHVVSIRTAGIHLFVWIRDVDAYYTEIRSRGVEIERDPANQPYGIRDFSLLDCNGHLRIVFGQDNELI